VTIVYAVPVSVAVVMMVLALILVPMGIIDKARKTSRQKARNEQLSTGRSPRPPARPYGM
jgi:hypothetical protein